MARGRRLIVGRRWSCATSLARTTQQLQLFCCSAFNPAMDDSAWTAELKSLLLAEADLHSLQKVCNNRRIPSSVRPSFWQVCLGVSGRQVHLEEFFDLEEQSVIREDCMKLVSALEDDDELAGLSIAGDIESIITTISKNAEVKYTHGNGWMELILPLISLRLKREEIYCCLEAILRKYIPITYTKCQSNPNLNREQPFHLLRLLILYHDPELCSFLDSKKVNPELYAGTWFRSLFSSVCNIEVIQLIWDEYLLLANPFAVFFLALVILINSRDIILEMKDAERNSIVSAIARIPQALEPEDVSDLFSLVQTHYVPHTPSVKYLHSLIFQPLHGGEVDENEYNNIHTDLAHALCLPVDVKDLVPRSEQVVKYFVIDCRSPDEYNSGHLSTAFHLDCSLMLQDKSAFEIAVQGLLMVQKQAIDANSVAGGNHLSFIGTGKNEEDSYVYMVVASFLQRNHKFVSLCAGGYYALHDLLKQKNLENMLVDHNPYACLACIGVSDAPGDLSTGTSNSKWPLGRDDALSTSIFDKLSTVVKSKTSEVKGKLVELVTAPGKDKYKGLSIFDPGEEQFDDIVDEVEVEVNVDQWAKEQDALHIFKCWEIKDNMRLDSFFILTEGYIYIVRESKNRRGCGKVVAKRPLDMILQITSKRRIPDVITFKYGEQRDPSDGGPNIIATDCLLFCESYKVTRLVKQQVIKVIDAATNESASS